MESIRKEENIEARHWLSNKIAQLMDEVKSANDNAEEIVSPDLS